VPYAREVIRSGLLIAPPGEVERRVQVKMNRQRVLARDTPLLLDVVLDEAAILRPVGDAAVMREQLAHLARIAGQPDVNLQMLPLAAGPHPATTGEFTILGFPELIAPDVVYLENMTSDIIRQFVEQPEDPHAAHDADAKGHATPRHATPRHARAGRSDGGSRRVARGERQSAYKADHPSCAVPAILWLP